MASELNSLVESWKHSVGVLQDDLTRVLLDDEIFDEMCKAISESGAKSGFWIDHYQRLCSAKQAMAVRRISRGKKGEIGLDKLLRDVAAQANQLTIDWYRTQVSTWSGSSEIQDEHFVQQFMERWCNSGNCIDAAIVRKDRKAFKDEVAAVGRWADTMIAHIFEEPTSADLTWGELRHAFEVVGEQLNRYSHLFFGQSRIYSPTFVFDWREPFTRRLFNPAKQEFHEARSSQEGSLQ